MGFDGGVVGALENVEDVNSVGEVFEVGVERVLELGDGGRVVDSGWGTGFEMVLEGELGSGGAWGVEFRGTKVHEAAREEGRGGGVVRVLLGSGSCPTADAVCDAHGVVADKVGIFADLDGKGGVWVSGWRGTRVEGAAVLGDPVCSDIELVLQPLTFRGPRCIRGGRGERRSGWRRNRVEIGRQRRVGREEGRMDGLGQGQLRMLRLFRGLARQSGRRGKDLSARRRGRRDSKGRQRIGPDPREQQSLAHGGCREKLIPAFYESFITTRQTPNDSSCLLSIIAQTIPRHHGPPQCSRPKLKERRYAVRFSLVIQLISLPAKKEAKRLEKEAKLAAKTAKAPTATKPKAEKEKPKEKEIEQPFVNTTPKGHKKGSFRSTSTIILLTIANRHVRAHGSRLQPHRRRIRMVRLVVCPGFLQARIRIASPQGQRRQGHLCHSMSPSQRYRQSAHWPCFDRGHPGRPGPLVCFFLFSLPIDG